MPKRRRPGTNVLGQDHGTWAASLSRWVRLQSVGG